MTTQTPKWLLIFILGVSGSWKATMVTLLKKNNPIIQNVLSWKTRPLREWEENGIDYHYISEEEFKEAIQNKEFLEYAIVHQTSYYGTKKQDIYDALEHWGIVLKEIDLQWLQDLARDEPTLFQNSLRIFLDISDATMRERILNRAPTSEDEIQRRLQSASVERALAKDYVSNVVSAELDIPQVYATIRDLIQTYSDQHGIDLALK